ncbi:MULTISPECIES: helix-turn-helix domain-containing protein [Ligilactobacillus]|uniref:Cro CI family phage transcriptional regulator n=1 Tax=Ligilactobacillus apodemi DSM 16634 = JCM 16172 TaxID=1423724 RepID=A0A0R1TWH7_9LACO|nr:MULTISPECIES: helix-turn-helix transcriptional regulator [Ligilactobacillus]KRL84564.1 Cro CI family phage transcriptional regulator [Ligilactobacillus apodemi DSM 16634 = JCM 16172]MCI5941105.1 helix-turn-helix transcriptional regulator [Ligilactobacillus animalis]MDY2993515.1 helix-turn-helix transcriptional regulator [Ligilactobacillus animalis]
MTGQRIRDLRKEKRISQTELANVVHVSQQTVTAWENDKAEPSSSAISKLADFFGVTTDYLLGKTSTPQFTAKHENDIQETLKNMIEGLTNDTSLAYLKNGSEEIDEESAALLKSSLESTLRQAQILAQQKFTPKKYRK